uniref:SSD domain-containing protein n=1 Tax=Elaeophora elaphi TaxID=1147741 RepID=A0A0R3RZG2_9BILA
MSPNRKGTTIHWENPENQKAENEKNDRDFSWNARKSASVSSYSDIENGNSWMHSQAYEVFPPSFHAYRRSSVLVGKRSMQLLEEAGEEEPKFVKFIIDLYNKWGFWIARFAWPAIIFCLLLSALAFVKISLTPQRNDLEGYSPFEARSRIEYNKYLNFFSGRGLAISTYLYITAKDSNSMLRPSHLNDTIEVLNLALNNITLYDPITNHNQSFNQFCKEFCHINEPVLQFYNAYMVQKWNLERGERPNRYLRLNYPISTLFGREIPIQPYFFGVELYKGNETKKDIEKETEGIRQFFGNDTDVGSLITWNETHPVVTNMKSVKMISLHLRALQSPQWSKDEMKRWEMDVVHFFENYKSDHLTIYVVSTTYIEEEMIRAGVSLLPYLTTGFIIMCTCSVITVMVRAAYMHQNNIFKIILAVMACTTPLLACSTGLAILFLCGIDSSYLMIHEWQRVTKEIRDGEKKAGSVGHRMSEVLSEVGPAILISAITNILADAVGCFTSSPEIRLLCIGNLFSMFVAYLYQMSFYSGLMSVVGKFEIAAERNEDNTTNIAIQKSQRKSSRFHDKSKLYISKYMGAYVNIIAHPAIATLIILLYITYVVMSVWGISRMNISLTPQKLFPENSPLIKLDNLRAEYQIPIFTVASVFVDTPGDLSQKLPLLLMNNMVQDFENLHGSWRHDGTMYFIRDFAVFQKFLQSNHDYDYESLAEDDFISTTTMDPDDLLKFDNDNLANFLTWPEYSFWSGFIQLQNVSADKKKKRLKRFFFTTAYHDEKLKEWTYRGKLLREWRAIVDKSMYESFHASVFHEDAIFLDLIDNMPTDTWQSIAGTLVCMGAVCFLFLRNMLTVVIATTSVLSVSIGILGILSWWNVDLDPISMAAMLISTGFSVDIPAHVAYHYCKASEKSTPQARLGNCLTSVGFPAVQAALSTILCVYSLWFAGIYMSQVFVKTMVTSVILCNLHGLVILPAILSIIHRIRARLDRNKVYKKPAERAVSKRLEEIRKRMARTPDIQERDENPPDLKMDLPPVPDFNFTS